MAGPDPFDLERFVTAQRSTFSTALDELKVGRKRCHWLWFIFPQLRGLGRSSTAEFYGLRSLNETRAYLAHPVLGPTDPVPRNGAGRRGAIGSRDLRLAG